MHGARQVGMGLAIAQHTDPEEGTAEETQDGFCPFSAFQSCLGRQADASEVLCRLRVSTALTQVWTVVSCSR